MMMNESGGGATPSYHHPLYTGGGGGGGGGAQQSASSCCFSKRHRKPPADSVLCCCCTCPTPTSSASVLTCLGVCIIVLVYTLIGAFAFMALEGTFASFRTTTAHGEETSVAASQPNPSVTADGAELRSKTVEKLWSITEDLNILYKDNWTRLAAREVMDFQDTLVKAMRTGPGVGYSRQKGGTLTYVHGQHRWSFSSSFLYSLTLITTIGYGNVTPKTPAGKLMTIAYALLGIPLMLVYLSTVGDVLARSFRRIYSRMCGRSSNRRTSKKSSPSSLNFKSPPGNHVPDKGFGGKSSDGMMILDCIDPTLPTLSSGILLDAYAPRKRYYHKGCPEQVRVPIILCMIIIVLYMSLGAVLFNKTENWTFLEGSYFCFTSLSTVGFGDLYPGQYAAMNKSAQDEDVALCVCSVYILIGMAVIAMCFNLVQDEIIVLVRKFNRACGGQTRHHVPVPPLLPPPMPIITSDMDSVEDISMSVVS